MHDETAARQLSGPLAFCIADRYLPPSALAQHPRPLTNADLKYTIAIPSECRLDEGPGTLEAICSADLDEAKAAEMPKAKAFLLEIDAEAVPDRRQALCRSRIPPSKFPKPSAANRRCARVKLINFKVTKPDPPLDIDSRRRLPRNQVPWP